MALLALHSCRDMPLVSEVHKVGEVVNLSPGDRLTALDETGQLLQFWTRPIVLPTPIEGYALGLCGNHDRIVVIGDAIVVVAVATSSRAGHASMPGTASIEVTILALDPQFTCMKLVRIGDRLLQRLRSGRTIGHMLIFPRSIGI
jgi:hypothetical protein